MSAWSENGEDILVVFRENKRQEGRDDTGR